MIYIYGYLGIGIIFFIVAYSTHQLRSDKVSMSLLLDVLRLDRKMLCYRILSNFFEFVLMVILIAVIWPIVVYMKVKEILMGGAEIESDGEFTIKAQHLLKQLTVNEIESCEVVTDPLSAVPELPFGHLNTAWREFLKELSDDSELWSFSAEWQTTWGGKELRSGYVIVRDGSPCAHFLTVLKELPDDALEDCDASSIRITKQ